MPPGPASQKRSVSTLRSRTPTTAWASCRSRPPTWAPPARPTPPRSRPVRALPRPTTASASCSAGRATPRARSRAFETAVRLDPQLFDAQYHLGATLWWTKEIDAHGAPLEAALALQPDHAEARYYLGLALAAQGDDRPRAEHLKRAVSAPPAWPRPSCSSGLAAQRAGGPGRGARRAAQGGASWIPASADARNSLGLALMQKGRGGGGGGHVPGARRPTHPETPDGPPQPGQRAHAEGRPRRRDRRLPRAAPRASPTAPRPSTTWAWP